VSTAGSDGSYEPAHDPTRSRREEPPERENLRVAMQKVVGSVRRETGMGKEMRELYVEGVAIHDGPESCVGVREGVGEALTGVRVGWVMEPRN
jgi:hypothetical protein